MKNKILITAAIVIAATAVGAAIYLIQGISRPVPAPKTAEPEEGLREESLTNEQEGVLETEDFSIELPEGWIKSTPFAGTSALAINVSEESVDPEAQKINFKTYLSIGSDVLGDKTREEFIEYVKEDIRQAAPDIVFGLEKEEKINGRETYFIEMEAKQQEINLKVLLVLIQGKENSVWLMSFNAVKDNWNDYKNLFYQIAETFRLK